VLTINALMSALVAELEEGEIPMPLAQSFTLANVWADLARLAGEELPAEALAVVGRALDATIEPTRVRRGPYAEQARQFAPAD
jgi:hypothetical protein